MRPGIGRNVPSAMGDLGLVFIREMWFVDCSSILASTPHYMLVSKHTELFTLGPNHAIFHCTATVFPRACGTQTH